MISHSEWMELSQQLESHHAIFDELWQVGRPIFTEEVATAAIRFSETGEYLDFLFNENYWNGLTPYERLFVISHECLHVILEHGKRTTKSEDSPRVNKALDVVVNHMLVNSFGFNRSQFRDSQVLCWVDTIFPGTWMPTNESYEYYYQKIQGSSIEVYCVDDHSMLNFDEKILKKIKDRLTSEDLDSLKIGIGTGEGNWLSVQVEEVKPKKKWETIIRKWSLKYLKEGLDEHAQWARIARRFQLVPSEILLPSEMEFEAKEADRLPIFLLLDTSGSCTGFRNRFFKAGMSLPANRFDVRLFCFDTKVKETTIESKKIYGGGGTSFTVIESYIQELTKKERIAYPEAVFVITDGLGNRVIPAFPERWHWFLAGSASRTYIPKGSKIYILKDFE